MKKYTGHVYKMLVRYGFSGFKALEICVDARRGDPYAMSLVRYIFSMREDFR